MLEDSEKIAQVGVLRFLDPQFIIKYDKRQQEILETEKVWHFCLKTISALFIIFRLSNAPLRYFSFHVLLPVEI